MSANDFRLRTALRAAAAAVAVAAAVVMTAPGLAAASRSAPAGRASSAKATAKPTTAPAAAAVPAVGTAGRRPLTLDTQRIEGRADAPRVLFIHTGPVVALEDAPKHPSYLRDDFTAALSAPIRVRVHAGEATRPSPSPGGTR